VVRQKKGSQWNLGVLQIPGVATDELKAAEEILNYIVQLYASDCSRIFNENFDLENVLPELRTKIDDSCIKYNVTDLRKKLLKYLPREENMYQPVPINPEVRSFSLSDFL